MSKEKLHILDYDTGFNHEINPVKIAHFLRWEHEGTVYTFDGLLEALDVTSYRAEYRGVKKYSSDIDAMDRD